MALRYFFIAGAGVGGGLCCTILPALLLYKKIESGGFKLWGSKNKKK